VKDIIISVISSWQVWVVTVAMVIYISIVRFVARGDTRRYRPASMPKVKKEKAKGKPAAAAPSTASPTDDLGLEEGGDDVPIQQEE